MKYNKNTFCYIEDGKVIACNSLSQDYYELDADHLKKLIEKSVDQPNHTPPEEIEQNLLAGGLLLTQAGEVMPWEGDPISFYAHQGTRIISQHTPRLDEDALCEEFSELSCAVQEAPPKYIPEYVKEIKLEVPDFMAFKNHSFYDVVKNRKTCRNFIKKPIDVELLSSLLYFCLGPIHGTTWEDFEKYSIQALGARHSSPSAAGMQGCDAYLAALNVTGLEPSIYLYSAEKHSLYQLKKRFEDDTLIYAMNDQFWAKNLSAGIFIVNDMRRTWVKDKKARGYLAAYLEAGHLSQTILLAATALELSTWITGTFRDDVVNEKLQLTGSPCFASFFIGLGVGNNCSIPETFTKTLLNKAC
jgi:SagB-type dehydrogenase family enzyme